MARISQLSTEAARAILARETDEVFLACLTISGDGLDTLRIVNNTEPVVRAAGEFSPYPFVAELPKDTDGHAANVTLQVDNVDRAVLNRLRDYQGIPHCMLEVIMASSPDHVEVGPFNFSLMSVEYDSIIITGVLGYGEDFLNQATPRATYTPTNSPGLFK